MKKKAKKHNASAITNPSQLRATKRYAPIFLWPTFIAFCIGFVWPFIWGIYLSFFLAQKNEQAPKLLKIETTLQRRARH